MDWYRFGAQGGVVDVASGSATEVGAWVCLVHRCFDLQPDDEVRIGKDHLSIGFEIDQARSQVSADLVGST